MFSVPPATTTWASPHWIAWAASITAFMPEPQTLLTVVAPTEPETGADGGLAGDVLPQAGPDHVAENHLIDLVRGQARAAQRFLDRHASQGRRRDLGQHAQKAADRGARTACEPNFVDHESRAFL